MLLLTVGVDLHCLDCSVVALNFISLHCTVLCCPALHIVSCVALYVRHWAGNLGWWPKPIYTLLQPADIVDGIAHCAILLAQASQCTFRQSFAQEQEHFTFLHIHQSQRVASNLHNAQGIGIALCIVCTVLW